MWDRPTSQKERKDPSHSGEHAPKTQQVHLIWGRHGRNPEPRVLAHHKTRNLQMFPPDSWLCFSGPFRGFRGPCLILPKKGSLGLPAPNAIGGNSEPSCAGKMKESYHLVLVQHFPPPPHNFSQGQTCKMLRAVDPEVPKYCLALLHMRACNTRNMFLRLNKRNAQTNQV